MNICSINRLLQASCNLLRAALGHAVVAVFVQIVLYAGLLGHGYDAGFVGGVAESHHKRQLLRLLNAQQRGQGGLIDRAHDAAAHALVPCGKGHVCQRNAGVGGKVAGDGGILHHSCIKVGSSSALGVPCSGGR